jgi:hypothetical protein
MQLVKHASSNGLAGTAHWATAMAAEHLLRGSHSATIMPATPAGHFPATTHAEGITLPSQINFYAASAPFNFSLSLRYPDSFTHCVYANPELCHIQYPSPAMAIGAERSGVHSGATLHPSAMAPLLEMPEGINCFRQMRILSSSRMPGHRISQFVQCRLCRIRHTEPKGFQALSRIKY